MDDRLSLGLDLFAGGAAILVGLCTGGHLLQRGWPHLRVAATAIGVAALAGVAAGWGWAMLSGGWFVSVGGAKNAAGRGEAFAVVADGSLWEYNPAFGGSHWVNLIPSDVLSDSAPLRR